MYITTAQDIHCIDDKTSSFIKLAKLQKIKVDVNKKTAGYYKIHF